MQPEPPFSDVTIHLRHSVVQPGNSAPSTSAITVPLSSGVDIGLVGRVLGLNPSTLRLNGYHVSRSRPSYVSSGLLWAQLLEFCAQRGLPCGVGIGDAIAVQGKHMGSTDGNPFMKREFDLQTDCPLKKRQAEITYISNNKCPSTKRSLDFQLETESSTKKRRLEINHRPNNNASTKRSVNSDDASVTFKKGTIAYSTADTQKSHTAIMSYLPIYLRFHSSVSFCGSSPRSCTITVSASSSVDIGLVGRVLGLDPKTVRLNGYYVSRVEPHYVSPGLSWGLLLNFFARRRLPCGSEVQDAIIVQGKYVGPTDENLVLKRKMESEAACFLKKRKLTNNKQSESVIRPIKRIIKSDDIQDPLKRMTIYSSICAQKSHTSMHVSNFTITV